MLLLLPCVPLSSPSPPSPFFMPRLKSALARFRNKFQPCFILPCLVSLFCILGEEYHLKTESTASLNSLATPVAGGSTELHLQQPWHSTRSLAGFKPSYAFTQALLTFVALYLSVSPGRAPDQDARKIRALHRSELATDKRGENTKLGLHASELKVIHYLWCLLPGT